MMLRIILCGVLCCVLTSCSVVRVNVNGDEMTLNEAFGGMEGGGEPHRMTLDARTTADAVSVAMPLSTALVVASESGHVCDPTTARIMNPPLAHLEVTHAQRVSMQVTHDGRAIGWMLKHADGSHLCRAADARGFNDELKAGEYEIFAVWRSGNVDQMKEKARAGTSEVALALHTYGVNASSDQFVIDQDTPNPYYPNGVTYRGGFVAPQELGFASSCKAYGEVSAQPLFELTLEDTQSLQLRDTKLVNWAVISEDDKAQCANPVMEKPGRYKVYALTTSEEVRQDALFIYEPVLWDETRAVTLTGEVPRIRTRGIKEPVVLQGVTRPDVLSSTKRCTQSKAKVGLEPDFFLEFERPTPGTRVLIVGGDKGPQELVLEDITTSELLMSQERSCARVMQPSRFDRMLYSLGRADGTYAGFIAHPGTPRDFSVIVFSEETELDPWLMVAPLPEQLDTLDSRVFPKYYPLYHHAWPSELETVQRVPEALRVYAKERSVASKSSSTTATVHSRGGEPLEVKPGESLWLVEVLDRRKNGLPGRVRVLTSDGWDMVIEGYTLTTAHPDTWE